MTDWLALLSHLEHPQLLWLAPILIVIMFFILRRDFVRLAEDQLTKRMRRRQQWVMLFTRILIICALVLALASPYVEHSKTVTGDPELKILYDTSTSMTLYPEKLAENLKAKLEQAVNVEIHSIASGDTSPLGDGILNTVKDGDSVILITDGQATNGAGLGDVALFAANHNITFNAINLHPTTDDAWVSVEGADKTVANVDNTFQISTGWASQSGNSVHLTVTIDGKLALDTNDGERTRTITKQFSEGYHQIEARIDAQDKFAENNVYYKTVKVVPKPKVFLWSQAPDTPIETLLRQIYDVTRGGTLTTDLSPYYSVVVNGVYGAQISDDDVTRLSDYIQDGNGMFVVGGASSYDRGAYQNSMFESLLPVVVGEPGREPGDVNIVILMDASASTAADEGGGIAIARQIAVSVLDQMSSNVKVGVAAFRNKAYLIAPLGYKYEQAGLDHTIATVYGAGSSKMHLGLQMATDMLKGVPGSKNIVMISDGLLFPNDQAAARDAVLLARKSGIKVYTVGAVVGDEAFIENRMDEGVLSSLAALGGGIYFRASQTSRLNLLFGNVKKPENTPQPNEWGVDVLDSNHFITDGLNISATIHGYNSVAPKTTGRMLVVTSTGEPLVTVWHMGLGRVVAYATDDGTSWAGELLGAGNSKLLVRSINWANGDPDRKSNDLVDVKDTHVKEATQLTLKTATQPTAQGLEFFKIKPDTYQASVTPDAVGFHQILGATYAANYPAELAPLGPSKELDQLIGQTGGTRFEADDTASMVAFAKNHATKTITAKDYFRWELALLASGLFLIEILLRRMMRR